MSVEGSGVKGGFEVRCEGSNKGGEGSVNKSINWIGADAGKYAMVIVRVSLLYAWRHSAKPNNYPVCYKDSNSTRTPFATIPTKKLASLCSLVVASLGRCLATAVLLNVLKCNGAMHLEVVCTDYIRIHFLNHIIAQKSFIATEPDFRHVSADWHAPERLTF